MNPFYAHAIDYLKAKILLNSGNYDDFKPFILNKLDQLKRKQYSKNLYFKFLLLLVKFYAEIENYTQVFQIIKKNLDFSKNNDLIFFYQMMVIYEAKCLSQSGRLKEALKKFKDNFFYIIRSRNDMKMLFQFEYALTIMRDLKS